MDFTQTINDIDADPIPDIKADTVEIVNMEPQDTLNYDSHEDDDPFDVDSDEDNQESDPVQLEKIQNHNNKSVPTKKRAIDGAGDLQKIPCTYCDVHFTTRSSCTRHIRECHADKLTPNQCPYCTYKSIYSLTAHIFKHHKDKHEIQWFRCYQCEFKAKSKHHLKQHITYKHTDPHEMIDQMHKCKKCPKMFKFKYHLNIHILQVHEKHNAKKLKCSQCDYECISSQQLQKHRDVLHSDFEKLDTLQCPECSYKTNFRVYLKEHIKRKHGDQKYQCEKCPYQTTVIASMKLHSINHKEVKDEADLTYRCDKCAYKTYRDYSLKIHKLNHLTPEETQYFFCYHCNFKAKRKDNLKTHVLRHFKHNEITLACYICEFTTVKRHLLVRHIEKHSKELSKRRKLVSVKTVSFQHHLIWQEEFKEQKKEESKNVMIQETKAY